MLESDYDADAPLWAVFGDLMAGLLGVFVLLWVGVLAVQLDVVTQLQAEVQRRAAQAQQLQALEQALAGPLAAGRITLQQGRIGISGRVLFALNSDQLQPEGQALLASLVPALRAYLAARDELLMVSGFTDDRQIRDGNRQFADNWELSAQRALTVTRTLIDAGLPATQVFAAAFGAQQPVASNADATSRALNRRVELAPVPRVKPAALGSGASAPSPAAQTHQQP
ncbi:MAG: OmpA family protein [Rhodoferax sp.]